MTIVHCPRCRDEVTVPARAQAKALVRCPLCLEEYLLGEALDLVPPALIVLDGSGGGDEPELVGAVAAADLVEAEAGGEYRVAGGGFEAALDSRPGEGATVSPARPGVKGTRPKRKPKSAIFELTKIVVGGLIGCILAPLVLWWVFDNDSLKLGPKVPRFADWLVPEKFRGKPDTSGDSASASNPAGGGSRAQPNPNDNGDNKAPPANGNTASGGKVSDLPADFKFPNPTAPTDPLNIENPLADASKVGPATAVDPLPEVKPAETNPAPFVPAVNPTKLNPPSETSVEPALPTAADFEKGVLAATESLATLNAANDVTVAEKQQLYTDLYAAAADVGRMTTYLSPSDADLIESVATLKTFLTALTMGKMNALKSLTSRNLPAHKHDEGVLVAGVVEDFQAAGSVFECTLQAGRKTASSDVLQTPVICASNPQDFCQPGDDLLILGRIVENPQKHIPGYEGEHQRVVLYGFSVTAAKAEPPAP